MLSLLELFQVLATDPHQHLNNLGAFKSWVENKTVHRNPGKEILLDDEMDAVMVTKILLLNLHAVNLLSVFLFSANDLP